MESDSQKPGHGSGQGEAGAANPSSPPKRSEATNQSEPPKAATVRYHYWEIDGKGTLSGKLPIAPGIEPDIYAEVTIDKKNGKAEVRRIKPGKKPWVRRFTLSKTGRVEKQEYQDLQTGGIGVNHYEYNPAGMMTGRYELNPRTGELRYRIEVVCDSHGWFKQQTLLGPDLRPRVRHVYERDKRGRIVKESKYVGPDLQRLEGHFIYEWDKGDRLVHLTWFNSEGAEINSLVTRYNDFDLEVEVGFEKGGKRQKTVTKEYDARGKLISSREERLNQPQLERDWGKAPTAEELQRAVRTMEKELALEGLSEPEMLAVLHRTAYTRFEAGLFDDARRIFSELAMLKPKDARYLAGVAGAALEQGQARTALTYYNRALMSDPSHIFSLLGQGEAYLRLGRKEEALSSFKQALKVGDPEHPVVKRARGLVAVLTRHSPPRPQTPVPQ
jgi:hypothetical protein